MLGFNLVEPAGSIGQGEVDHGEELKAFLVIVAAPAAKMLPKTTVRSRAEESFEL
jgi:hypothetical protein